MTSSPPTYRESIRLERTGDNEFVSVYNPERLGNVNNIAYGGCATGLGINAAYHTVKPGFHLYSVLGNYLGPVLTDAKVQVRVKVLRDTRTFATRTVEIIQEFAGKGSRTSVFMLLDFQTQEPATLMEYSVKPQLPLVEPGKCMTYQELGAELVKQGKLDAKTQKMRDVLFALMDRQFETRGLPEGVGFQNLYTVLNKTPTTQDHLPLTDKVTGEWVRCKHPVETEAEHMAALAFYSDAATGFVSLMHDHRALFEAGAASSLDFALRIMTSKVDLNAWNLREIKTVHGGEGRTYNEGRMWNKDGRLVASMTQQCILRPLKKKGATL